VKKRGPKALQRTKKLGNSGSEMGSSNLRRAGREISPPNPTKKKKKTQKKKKKTTRKKKNQKNPLTPHPNHPTNPSRTTFTLSKGVNLGSEIGEKRKALAHHTFNRLRRHWPLIVLPDNLNVGERGRLLAALSSPDQQVYQKNSRLGEA